MVVKTRRRQRAGGSLRGDLFYDSWSLSHLGYLYPGTTPVMGSNYQLVLWFCTALLQLEGIFCLTPIKYFVLSFFLGRRR